MIGQKGTIVAISGDPGSERALVAVDAAVACARCARGAGCGAGLASNARKTRQFDVPLPRDSHLTVGDSVNLELDDRRLLAAAGVVYGWPLGGAAIAAMLAYLNDFGDAAAAASVLAGLAGGLVLVKRRLRRPACQLEFAPRIVR